MIEKDSLERSLLKLVEYIEAEKYMGYDPYDMLRSKLFKLPVLKNSKWIRFGAQQFGKRFPINLRPLFLISKGLNPVTLGLCIQGYANLFKVFPEKSEDYTQKINFLVDELNRLIPKGYHGACWGYDFDWEARHASIPAYQPTIVATGIITNALFSWYKISGDQRALNLCVSASSFILNDINRTYDENGNFCFSYSPFDHLCVFNASMKGARCLAQVYSVTRNEDLKAAAISAAGYVMKNQGADGSWTYSTSTSGDWIDNYHTGYILECMDEFMQSTGERSHSPGVEKGFHFYRKFFFTSEGIPKFYDKEIYPVDCTAAAQSILILIRFGNPELAEKVSAWMIQNMQSQKGNYYFRKMKNYTVHTSFMRWSNAWMFVAGSELLKSKIISKT